MRIINRANGRETTMSSAVSIVTDCDDVSALRDMMTRLLEELTANNALRPKQLARVLAYGFEVTEE